MALRAANGLLDGVTALLVLLAVVWSGYALWDNSRVYAAADNVQAGLLAFKPQPQEDNSLSFGQLRDINPDIKVTEYSLFYMPETADQIDLSGFDCIVDAIDTVTAKLHLIQTAKALGVPIISSMGTGNKLRPDLLTASDISKTTTCPLARVMRRELRARGIEHLRVVYSTEPPRTPKNRTAAPAPGQPRPKDTPGSSPWVPSSAGLLIASEVIARLLGEAEW